jgi:glycosyltransferase involved in cell wall biosynthesis
MSGLRVIHFSPFLGMSGANRALVTLVEEEARRRPVFVFALSEGDLSQEAREVGATVATAFGHESLPRGRPRRWAGIVSGLARAVRRHRIQLVHCHSSAGNRHAWPAARMTGVPLVGHQRDSYRRDYFNLGTALSDHIIAVSESVLATLPPRLRGRATVIHDAVTLPPPAALRPPVAAPLQVGMAGRCVPEKGQDLFIEAAISLLDLCELDVHLWGLDDTPFARSLRERIVATGPKARARFHLEPFRGDMQRFYSAVDIVVVPSRLPEPFGLMAAEAMAWAKAVVVAAHGGLLEIVRHGETGLTFQPNDGRDLRAQLQRLLCDRELRCRLGQAARAAVESRFTPRQHADKTESVYDRLIRRGA